jgi:hypothetical protein
MPTKPNEYGTCSVCNKPFDYPGEDFVRLQRIRNYHSQGYPDQFVRASFDCHQACLPDAMGILERFNTEMKQKSYK